MRKILLACISTLAGSFVTKAQNCPTASFTISDSICAGSTITLTNTSSGGNGALNSNWDFCPGDLAQQPAYAPVADFGSFANLTYGLDLVEDSGNWYGFTLNAGSQSVTRFDFGNSLLNLPVPFDLGNIGGILASETDIKLIKENGLWYAFICKFNCDIVRIEFGASITNPAPAATLLTITPGLIANPFIMALVRDHGSFKILTANLGGNNVTLVDIGPSITNNVPAVSNISSTINGISGITVVRECDHWYAFTISRAYAEVFRIDFGDTITSTPLSVVNTGVTNNINGAYEIEVFQDGGNWYGFTLGFTICRINFGPTLNVVNPPVDNLGIALNGNESNISMRKQGSQYVGIVTYAISDPNPDLRRLTFPDNCNSNQPTSTDTHPSGIIFSGTGFHEVTLEITDASGNTSHYTDSVYLEGAPTTSFVHSVACLGTPVVFTDSSYMTGGSITSWNWDFGDSSGSSQQNPSHSYASGGDYVVTLQAGSSSGCISSFTDTVSVRALPVASFTFTDNSCAGIPVPFTDLSSSLQDPVVSWSWDFGDSVAASVQNPSHSYAQGGTYVVYLTVTTDRGCSSVYSDSIHIRPRPVPGFNVFNTCIGETVSFVNLTTISDSSALTYSWDLGDLTTSTLDNPVHAYAPVVSVYNVTLIASSPNGCSDTLTREVRIGNKPIPAFTVNPATVCKGNAVSFTDQSIVPGSDPGDTINSWQWNFGDQVTSTLQNPVHTYADTGTYAVSLTVSSPTYCDSTVMQVVQVIDAPEAAFNYSDNCFGNANNFIDFSTAPSGSVITTRNWDFGDSTTATGATVSHTYAAPGIYDVVLTVIDTFGCTDFVMHQVTIYPVPVASFTNSTACTNSPVTFINTSAIGGNDSIVSYFWDLGDGSTSTAVNPAHAYTTPNTKTVLLIATSVHGCIDSTYQLIFVNPSPNPSFAFNTTCQGEATQFTYIANPFPSTIASYLWTFGDLGSSVFENPIHTYASANTYQVTVTVTDLTGCTASITLPVDVHPIPAAGFISGSGCAGVPTQFTDSSMLSSGTISSYAWNFGNGNVSALASPAFTFDSAGTYVVNLQVISDAGCADSVSNTITVVENPVAAFSMSSTIGAPPFQVSFSASVTGATSYTWDFGDGTTGSTANPSHIYTDTGTFTVLMVCYNQEGCSDSMTKTLTVLIPHLDLAVTAVSISRQNGLMTISADLFNLGNVLVNTFEIAAQLEGGTIIHESVNKPFPPGIMKYDFTAKFETNSYTDPAYVCVETSRPNGQQDENTGNDRKCSGTGDGFQVIDIYHDPATGLSVLHFNLPLSGQVTLEVYDISGRKVAGKTTLNGNKGLNTFTLDSRTFSKGAYSCVMRYREEKKSKRLYKF